MHMAKQDFVLGHTGFNPNSPPDLSPSSGSQNHRPNRTSPAKLIGNPLAVIGSQPSGIAVPETAAPLRDRKSGRLT